MARRAAPPPPGPPPSPDGAALRVAPRRRTAAEAVEAGRVAQLREAAAVAARVVARRGKTFLPIFLRLEAELARIDAGETADDAALRRARAMAEAAGPLPCAEDAADDATGGRP
jgi:hypothetical protein